MTNKLYKIMKQSYKRKAFTLIELIIVIAVIAILAGLALPKFLGVRRNANVSAMYGDIDALEKAITMYNVNSDDDSYPIGGEALNLETLPSTLQNELAELGDSGSQLYEIDDTLLEKYIQRTKFNKDDYIYSMETGIVISKPGKVDSDDNTHHTNSGVVDKDNNQIEGDVIGYNIDWLTDSENNIIQYIGEFPENGEIVIPNVVLDKDDPTKKINITGVKASSESSIFGKDNTALIKKLTISNRINNIGSGSFKGATNLEELIINSKDISFGESSFEKASKLKEFNFEGDNLVIETNAFASSYGYDKEDAVYKGIEKVNINSKNINIQEKAFVYINILKEITIQGDNAYIGQYAFGSAASDFNLDPSVENTSLTINVKDLEIDQYAFDCTNRIKTTNITGDNITIKNDAFNNSMTYSHNYPDIRYTLNIKSKTLDIGNNAFAYSNNIGSIDIIGDKVTIGDNAFMNCTRLANLNINAPILNIGYQGFLSCNKLANLTIKSDECIIGKKAFQNCTNLANLNINAPILNIGYQ